MSSLLQSQRAQITPQLEKDVIMSFTVQDETRYCDNCGISFLWTGEEQRLENKLETPVRCPGCRQLLPDDGRERGMVKWYNARKRFGFIVRPGAEEIFVHRSALKGTNRLREGDLVEYRVADGKSGLAAHAVRVLVHEKL